jgi:GT2 family glycosyltransferase
MAGTPLVTVAIPNWNGRRHLERCLPAVQALRGVAFETIVVDNGSTDGSLELLRERFPWVRLIANPRNLGFAPALNQAIRASTTRYIAALNNDAIPYPDWLCRLVEVAEQDSHIGSCASRMVFDSHPHLIQSAGIAMNCAGIAWDRHVGEPDRTAPDAPPEEVFGASGGAALYRRAMLDEIGLFDERFGSYLEDVDLAWRARLAGWRCLYVPAAVVRHAHSATGGEGSPFKNYYLGRNKLWCIAKNYPWPQVLWYLPVIVLYDLGSLPYTVVVRRDPSPLVGRLAALRGLGPVLAERRRVQRLRRISWRDFCSYLEALEPPHTLFRRYRVTRTIAAGRDPARAL